MKNRGMLVWLVGAGLAFALSAYGHEGHEHKEKGKALDCSSIKDMDHSKMDMNDPVMQALMQKCMKAQDSGSGTHDETSPHQQEGKQEKKRPIQQDKKQ